MIMKPDLDDFYRYKNTQGPSGGGGGFGSGIVVIVIVVIFLISFLSSGASFAAVETLLAFGIIAYLLVRFLFD